MNPDPEAVRLVQEQDAEHARAVEFINGLDDDTLERIIGEYVDSLPSNHPDRRPQSRPTVETLRDTDGGRFMQFKRVHLFKFATASTPTETAP